MKIRLNDARIVLPSLCILFPLLGIEVAKWADLEATVRMFFLIFFYVSIIIFLLFYFLSRRTELIKKNSKIMASCGKNTKQRVNIFIRFIGICFTFMFFFYGTLPILNDIRYLLTGGELQTMTINVDKNQTTLGLWFLSQNVQDSSDVQKYHLLYSVDPLKVGDTYDCLVLPHSKQILMAN